jgi:hypothetical protein
MPSGYQHRWLAIPQSGLSQNFPLKSRQALRYVAPLDHIDQTRAESYRSDVMPFSRGASCNAAFTRSKGWRQ